MAVVSALGVFGGLALDGNLVKIMIDFKLTILLIYYSYLIKNDQMIVNQSDNIELGENNPNENTGIILHHNSNNVCLKSEQLCRK